VTWPGAFVLATYLAVYFGVFGSFAATVANPWRKKYAPVQGISDRVREMSRSLAYASLLGGFWCGLEWLRGILFTGFGWNGLGVTFANNLILAQNAEYVGVIGLAFLPVVMSAVAVQTGRRFYQQFMASEVKMLHWDFAVALLLVMLSFTVGVTRLSSVTKAPKIEARVLLVQQNIPQFAGVVDPAWPPHRIVDGFIELTEEGLEQSQIEAGEALRKTASEEEVVVIKSPDLVVWPEACLPGFVLALDADGGPRGGELIESIFGYVTKLGDFTFVTGINEYAEGTPADPDTKYYNSLVVDSGEEKRMSFQKHHLVVFGEYLPDVFGLHDFFQDFYLKSTGQDFGSGITAGTHLEPLSFQVGDEEVGMIPSICFEDTVPRVTRKFVRNEPQLLVNITNDGWFGESEGSQQHFRNALFRSIELRRPMVRAANRGVTGVVSATGSLTDPYVGQKRNLMNEDGKPFQRGYLLASSYILVTGLLSGLAWLVFYLVKKRFLIQG